jgi:uncharacterized integral membrane protein (TIGR00697 family)
MDERRVDLRLLASLDAGLRGQARHPLVGADVLRPAVGIAGVIHLRDADEDVLRPEHLRPRQRVGEKDRVARRHVGDGDAAANLVGRAVFRQRDVGGERRAAEDAKVDDEDLVARGAERSRDARRRVDLGSVPLAVVERQRVRLESALARDGQCRGRVDAAAQEHDGPLHEASVLSNAMSWRFVACAALFVTCLLTANTIAAKLIVVGGVVLTAGIVIFPISYVVGDVLTEVWGYAAARRVIWLGFACNALMVAAIWIGGQLPPAPFWKGDAAYAEILGHTPRIVAASFVAYLVGEFANSFVLAKLKVATRGRWLWLRTLGSTVVGQALDSGVFVTLAFAGTVPAGVLAGIVAGQWVFKVLYEAAATPLTYAAVGWLKAREGIDTYDYDTDFNPVRLS